MNHSHIWVNLKDSYRDVEFARNVAAHLGRLKDHGKIAAWTLTRRKFGFGPEQLGEYHIVVSCDTLAQLDEAFMTVAPREGEIQKLHAAVYSMVTDFKSALYRDFPDAVRDVERPGSR
jgi:hypothetical protein